MITGMPRWFGEGFGVEVTQSCYAQYEDESSTRTENGLAFTNEETRCSRQLQTLPRISARIICCTWHSCRTHCQALCSILNIPGGPSGYSDSSHSGCLIVYRTSIQARDKDHGPFLLPVFLQRLQMFLNNPIISIASSSSSS